MIRNDKKGNLTVDWINRDDRLDDTAAQHERALQSTLERPIRSERPRSTRRWSLSSRKHPRCQWRAPLDEAPVDKSAGDDEMPSAT